MKSVKTVLSIAFCLTLVKVSAQPAFITDSLDTYITREMQRWNIPGVAIAIVKDGKVMVNGKANIIASIPASNGIIHVIDEVLLPPQ